MSNIVPYNFEGAAIRALEIDGEPWFVGKDIAEALGYSDPTTAIRSHCRGVQKLHPIADTLGRKQDTRLLSEPDVLRLIVNSTLPAAERFERWVFEEVLPSIRKTGSYSAPRKGRSPVSDEVRALAIVRREIAKVPGVKEEIATSVFLQAVEKATGLPTTEMRLALPGASAEEARKMNPTQVAAALGTGLKAQTINVALIELGLQKKTERGEYAITDAGTQHGEMIPFTRHGHSSYQPLWFESVIEVLQRHFAQRSNVVALS